MGSVVRLCFDMGGISREGVVHGSLIVALIGLSIPSSDHH